MEAVPTILTKLTNWRRAPAIAGLVALALLHISAASHQFEHSAEHDLGVCEACGTYSQLEDSALPVASKEQLLPPADVLVAAPLAANYEAPVAAAYRSRAPPRS